ncbi:hypothetical protein [Paenibacillus sp. GbtcB18]|uniref:hypothetical protein n=1 Tax=Paenibacillus sp. GbtcB18 TaxID=2824763 RepID=UPI001C2FB052|nr:hypothetical protein [Paenibacillus sp. GbtcB18]
MIRTDRSGTDFRAVPSAGLKFLELDMPVLGNLHLHFDAGEEAYVKLSGEYHLFPAYTAREGDRLILKGRNLPAYLRHGQKERLRIDIHLPEDTAVDLTFLAGVISLNGGYGPLSVKGFSGEVSGYTGSDRVRVRLRCGDVSLAGLPGEADIRIGLGSSTLRWSRLLGTEHVRVRCAFGGVELLVPPEWAQKEEQGGFFKKKRLHAPPGATVSATVWFGGLDVGSSRGFTAP